MAQTASARNAIGSLLGAVAAASNSVSSLFNTTADSVGMLNKYVSDASDKQRISSDYDLATFEEKLLTSLATAEAKTNREIKVFFAESPENQAMWEAAYARIAEAVKARRNPTYSSTSSD